MKNTPLASIIILIASVLQIRADTADQAPVMMSGLEVANISVASAVVSWVTDQKTSSNWVELRPADLDSLVTFSDKYAIADYVHYVEITGLTPDREYLYRIGSGDRTWDNQGGWYSFHTLKTQPQSIPKAIVCLVQDTYGQPLSRVLVRIKAVKQGREPSATRVMLTKHNGWWDTAYTTILTTDGALYEADRDDRLIIDYLVNYWSLYTDSSAVLTGDFSQSLGQVQIPVYDPDKGTKGDLDGDGAINVFDLLDLLRIVGGQTAPPLDQRLSFTADLNADGSVNIMDLLTLLQILGSSG